MWRRGGLRVEAGVLLSPCTGSVVYYCRCFSGTLERIPLSATWSRVKNMSPRAGHEHSLPKSLFVSVIVFPDVSQRNVIGKFTLFEKFFVVSLAFWELFSCTHPPFAYLCAVLGTLNVDNP